MKHILFILDYYPPHRGGAENVYQHIIEGLLEKGHTISLLTTRFSPELKRFEQQNNYNKTSTLTIYRTGTNRKNFIFSAIMTGRKILKTQDIDVIHTATYGGAIPAWILAKFFKKKIFLTVHEVFGKLRNIYKGYWGALPYRWFEKVIFSLRFDMYHCVSRYTMNSLRLLYGIPDHALHMIYNGIDQDFWNPENINEQEIAHFKKTHHIAPTKTIGLYYGHSGKSKGLQYLITSIIPLLKENPDLQFIFNIIASKQSKTVIHHLKALRKKYHLEDRLLIFDGFALDALRLLVASSDFVVAPSLAEGFGSVHSEVSRMKKILITTEVGAIPEVVSGKIIFIPPCDSNAIIQAIDNVKSGTYLTIPQKNFSRKKSINELETLYYL